MIRTEPRAPLILFADDDADDRLLVREAFEENCLGERLRIVESGAQLLDYLHRRGEFSEAVRPGLILLDLNMPCLNGLEVLREIKADDSLRRIPVIVLTTSGAAAEIGQSYDLGVSSFIVKPVTFEALVELVAMLRKYWFQTVELPCEV